MDCITRGLLNAGHRVKVLAMETDKHPMLRGRMSADYVEQTQIESVYVDLGIKLVPAAVAMLCGESYHVKRYVSPDFAAKLKEVLQSGDFEVIHVESIFLTPYVPLIRKYSKAAVILRAHNVENLIWRQVAENARHGFKRWYLKHLALTLRAYELEHVNDYDGVACITGIDADYFRRNGCRRPIEVIPFGIEPPPQPQVASNPKALFHIGAMDWIPNQEGVAWLLEEVWPEIHRAVPEARLYLAGRKMPEQWTAKTIPGVEVLGEVPDAAGFIADKQINIVPLLSGGGIRVKIIEAMSMGKTVVSTTVGAQGIDYIDGEHLLIADSPEAFAMQVKRCIDSPDYGREIGAAAARLIHDNYNTATLTARLIAFYNRIITKK